MNYLTDWYVRPYWHLYLNQFSNSFCFISIAFYYTLFLRPLPLKWSLSCPDFIHSFIHDSSRRWLALTLTDSFTESQIPHEHGEIERAIQWYADMKKSHVCILQFNLLHVTISRDDIIYSQSLPTLIRCTWVWRILYRVFFYPIVSVLLR